MSRISDNTFKYTPIADGTGKIYVPSDLVDTYKADAKWGVFHIDSIDNYVET